MSNKPNPGIGSVPSRGRALRGDRRSGEGGVALIIVMIVIVVLGTLAGGFAFSMRVETKLAGNASLEPDMEWLGRSGIELAKYVLAEQANMRSEPYTSLNQRWAGGVGVPLDFLAEIQLENLRLGMGTISVKIEDAERRININVIDDEMIDKVLFLMGGTILDDSVLKDSLADWIDLDDDPHLSGTETEDYLRMDPPYAAKNGPLDRLHELLMINGMTPGLYYGTNDFMAFEPQPRSRSADRIFGDQFGTFNASFEDVFTTVGTGKVNINTASSQVLQLLPGIDASVASGILSMRAGFDGVDGSEDDIPFRSVADLISVPGMNPQFAQIMSRYLDVNSSTFDVEVTVNLGGYRRTYRALLLRLGGANVQAVRFTWD